MVARRLSNVLRIRSDKNTFGASHHPRRTRPGQIDDALRKRITGSAVHDKHKLARRVIFSTVPRAVASLALRRSFGSVFLYRATERYPIGCSTIVERS
jgi:hypothetical protein